MSSNDRIAVWSKPHFGVSHAEVFGRQCTVEDHGSFVTATVFPPLGTSQFFSRARERDFESIEEAKTWAERAANPEGGWHG